jgi:hypothetical protein
LATLPLKKGALLGESKKVKTNLKYKKEMKLTFGSLEIEISLFELAVFLLILFK